MADLDKRLEAVASLVRRGRAVADIGADHGQLVCALVESGKCPRGFACDVNPGPLAAAKAQIVRRNLQGLVQAVLTDGLAGLPHREIGDIVIAGMGGELIWEIMLAAPWIREPDKHYVLQPMTRAPHLRKCLYQSGFAIHREIPVRSGKFVYAVMSVGYTGQVQAIPEIEAWTGKIPAEATGDAVAYLAHVADTLEKQAEGLVKGAVDDALARQRKALAEKIRERMNQIHVSGSGLL